MRIYPRTTRYPRVKHEIAFPRGFSDACDMEPFERQIASLKEMLLTMANHAEAAVYKVMEALAKRDYDLARRIETDDTVIDRFELDVDDLAIKLLPQATRAGDLRFITVAMKVSQNLERVGDETTTIGRRVQELCQDAPLKLALDLPQMAALAAQMLKRALDAFVQQDSAAARALIPEDKQVDRLNKQNHQQLAAEMIRNPEGVTRCLSLMVISKSLERIADHAKNVAEEVVYLCEARDIRHSGPQEPPPGLPPAVTKP